MQLMPSAAPPFDRAVALACTSQTLRGRWLYVRCARLASSCRPVRLILRSDPGAARSTLADVPVRLRPDACKARPASIHLTETASPPDVVGAVVPGWHRRLHGTESGVDPSGSLRW